MSKHLQGKLSIEQLSDLVSQEVIDTIIVSFTDHYGRMMGKRFDADFFLESALANGTHACNYLLTTDIEMEPVHGYEFANWELGYGDFHLVPDAKTIRVAAWLEKTAIVFCDLANEKTHQEISESPRTILKIQVSNLAKQGFSSKAASELEYYLFENSFRNAHEADYHQLKPVGWYLEDYNILQGSRTEHFHGLARKSLKKSGIPVENSKGEWGLGQHELNIKYADILEMSDRHIVFKQCLKEIADSKEMSITFMAKYKGDQAGSSCHIHLSLWENGKNAFAGEEPLGDLKCSQIFKWFLGGWIKNVQDIIPFYAPNINSYKRFVDGSWAPTRVAWSYDNRTAGFRIVGKGQSLRIECRIPGADCNPYLAFAASLACGINGITNKIEPPEIFEGDIYAAQHLDRVPYTLKEANEKFKHSEFAKQAFGENVVKHYSHHFDEEVKAFEAAVTNWEKRRYFERI